jgi:hypothetical protein
MGWKRWRSSDFRCGRSARLETPTALAGHGVESPSGLDMPKVLGSWVSKLAGANDSEGLRILGVDGFGEGRC